MFIVAEDFLNVSGQVICTAIAANAVSGYALLRDLIFPVALVVIVDVVAVLEASQHEIRVQIKQSASLLERIYRRGQSLENSFFIKAGPFWGAEIH